MNEDRSAKEKRSRSDCPPENERAGKKRRTGPIKKNQGRQKIEIKYIEDKKKRLTTFSRRKGGLMKKVYELTKLTGSDGLVVITSETGHVYTFATPLLQRVVSTPEGKQLIRYCLNTPNQPSFKQTPPTQGMSAPPTSSPLQPHSTTKAKPPTPQNIYGPPQTFPTTTSFADFLNIHSLSDFSLPNTASTSASDSQTTQFSQIYCNRKDGGNGDG